MNVSMTTNINMNMNVRNIEYPAQTRWYTRNCKSGYNNHIRLLNHIRMLNHIAYNFDFGNKYISQSPRVLVTIFSGPRFAMEPIFTNYDDILIDV